MLHITNGDVASGKLRASGVPGDVLAWRDVLHEGPVPIAPLPELSRIRADYLASHGLGDRESLRAEFADRDASLMRFMDHEEVVLWFEWDLYDQLQLIQLLDFLAAFPAESLEETKTSVDIVCIEGYLGTTPMDRFPSLYDHRAGVSAAMLELGREAWRAFRSPAPVGIEVFLKKDTTALPYLAGALERHLEEFPSVDNGLSRSESQLLEAVSSRPLSFAEMFKRASNREERRFCGDAIAGVYLERMSQAAVPLVTHPSGERIDAPPAKENSAAFRNAEIALTEAGRSVLSCESDWIEMGGSDRWLGGVRLAGRGVRWRWDPGARSIREVVTGTRVD